MSDSSVSERNEVFDMSNATCKSNDRIDFSKPPVGKVYVPIETNEEDIQLSGIDRKYVTRHTYSATTKTVKMVLVDEEYADCGKSYVASIKGERRSVGIAAGSSARKQDGRSPAPTLVTPKSVPGNLVCRSSPGGKILSSR